MNNVIIFKAANNLKKQLIGSGYRIEKQHPQALAHVTPTHHKISTAAKLFNNKQRQNPQTTAAENQGHKPEV